MKRYYRKNRSSVALFLVSNLLAAGSSVFMSFLLGTFADSAMEGDLSRVWKIALVTLFYLCIETFFAFLLDYSRDIVVQRVGRGLRADAVRKIEALSYMEKSEKDDGACLSLMQNDVDTIQQDYVAALGEIYFQICCFLLAVASAIAIQPVMTLIMIAVSVLTAAFPKLTEKRLQAHQENEQQAKARYLTAITQIFSGFFQLKFSTLSPASTMPMTRQTKPFIGKSSAPAASAEFYTRGPMAAAISSCSARGCSACSSSHAASSRSRRSLPLRAL